MAENSKPSLQAMLITAVATGALLAACWYGYWYVADLIRKPPFRGTMVAELRVVSMVIISFAVLSIAQWVLNRVLALRK